MCNSNKTEEAHSVNLTSGVDSNEEIAPEDSDSIFNLDIKPNKVHFIEKNQRPDLFIYRLRKSF